MRTRLSLACLMIAALWTNVGAARVLSSTGITQAAPVLHDGQRDFDFHIGTWRTRVKRLVKPLTGSTTWAEYEGTTVVRKVLDGRSNLVELRVKGPAGQIDGLSLRLYNTQSRQWSLFYSNIAAGTLELPTVGTFNNKVGEFFSQDSIGGRAILVRFVITPTSPTEIHFEQAFSADGGRTWETNWIATDTRIADVP